MSVTLFHNPKCSTSRNALALIRERGMEPTVVDYLKHPPSRATLQALVASSGQGALYLVRTKEPLFKELHLDAPGVTDDQLLDALAAHPVLLNRPVVQTERGARVGRPIERMLEVLPEK